MLKELKLDPAEEVDRIAAALRRQVAEECKRRGVVVGMSGGVDSSVCAGLAVEAFGPTRVLGLFMPETDSDPADLQVASGWAETLGIATVLEDITTALEGCGMYRRRDEAIRRVVPEFGEGWRCKITLPDAHEGAGRINVYYLTVRSPGGEERHVRLPSTEYRQIVAATNFKQRARKIMEYYHADRLHYAVLGTPNRLEYDQGFFVKGGDGLADVKPIAHLYKSQVYQLAAHLGVPREITDRPPTTGTYSLAQSQDEFYFRLPVRQFDVALYAHNAGMPAAEVADELGCTVQEAESVFHDIEQKRATTRYLHAPPLLVDEVLEIG